MDAVLAGDQEAFRVLVERESPAVIRACYRILGDPHDAEDAAQEAFVIAYRSLGAWRGDGPFGAWLARIAVRVALRKRGRRRTVTWMSASGAEALPQIGAPLGRAVGLDRAKEADGSAGADPAVVALRSERAADVRVALNRLDDPYREVVALRFFGELALAEIAAELRRPLGTVKTQLHRGLIRLRELLADQGLEG